MSKSAEWGERYDSNRRTYESLRQEVLFILEAALAEAGIKTHSVTARVKDRARFLEKIERKTYADPFVDTTDLVGARVVCLFLEDLPKLEALAETWFDVLEREDKVDGGSVDAFGYMSHHYVCRLRQEHTGPRYDRIKDIRFELQCRTLLQDAWANVSHHLAYKGEYSIPEELQRDFHALSGLFYVADQHFQLFFGASQEAEEEAVEELATTAEPDLRINRPRLRALLRQLYPGRRASDAAAVSEFVEELHEAGIESIDELRAALQSAKEVFPEYEAERPPAVDSPDGKYADIGAARLSLAISHPRYAEAKYGSSARFAKYRSRIGS